MTTTTAGDRVEDVLDVLAATTDDLGPTGRAAVLAVAALEGLGLLAHVDRVAAIVGVTPKTFRYRTDGEYLKRLTGLGFLKADKAGNLRLGDRAIRG